MSENARMVGSDPAGDAPKREILRFLRRLFVSVVLPAVVLSCLIEFWAWRVGATRTAEMLARDQLADNQLIADASGGEYWSEFKLEAIRVRQPDVISVGSSRCHQFRAGLFAPYKFYNACLTAWTLNQIADFIVRARRVSNFSTVIFTLDYFMFTDEYEAAWSETARQKYDDPLQLHLSAISYSLHAFHDNVLETLRQAPSYLFSIVADGRHSFLGINPIIHRQGIRGDGSRMFTDGWLKSQEGFLGLDFLRGVHGGVALSEKRMADLKRLADIAKENGVTLIGLQLPIFQDTIDILDNDESYRPYAGIWRSFRSPEFKKTVNEWEIHFFDLAHPPITADRTNFIDPAHVSEIGSFATLVRLTEDPEFNALFPRLDPAQLKEEYTRAKAAGRRYEVRPGS